MQNTNPDEYGIYNISAEQRKTIDAMAQYGFKPWHSGGGCSAMRKGNTETDFWLLTVEDDPSIPNLTDKVALCHFSDEFEHDAEVLADNIPDLIEKMKKTLSTQNTPENVAQVGQAFLDEITGWFERDGDKPTAQQVNDANDFYDANMAMEAAFKKCGISPITSSQDSTDLWNAAWAKAVELAGAK